MANVVSTNGGRAPARSIAQIAGPRRVRVVAVKPEQPPPIARPAEAPALRVLASTAPPLSQTVQIAPLELPSLDYDEPTTRRPTLSGQQATRLVGDRRRPVAPSESSPRAARWFAMGLIVGVIAVMFARGDAMSGMRAARMWSASQLRSLKKAQEPARVSLPEGVASMSSIPAVPESPPCSLTDEDCAILMAPFIQAEAQSIAAQEIPEVDVSALPKWKPPIVYVAPLAAAKPIEIASPVAVPEIPSAAGPAPSEEPAPKAPAKRAPGPFDAPPPIDGPGAMASAPAAP